jgi:transposase
MDLSSFLRLPEGFHLLDTTLCPSGVKLQVCSQRPSSPCPQCAVPSEHIHSSYSRTVADIPCTGRQVTIQLHVRKFRCRNSLCSQKIFTERFPTSLRPWARKTVRLVEQITTLAMIAGGRGTETLAPTLGIRVSDQTTLRLLTQDPQAAVPSVTVLGVVIWFHINLDEKYLSW